MYEPYAACFSSAPKPSTGWSSKGKTRKAMTSNRSAIEFPPEHGHKAIEFSAQNTNTINIMRTRYRQQVKFAQAMSFPRSLCHVSFTPASFFSKPPRAKHTLPARSSTTQIFITHRARHNHPSAATFSSKSPLFKHNFPEFARTGPTLTTTMWGIRRVNLRYICYPGKAE